MTAHEELAEGGGISPRSKAVRISWVSARAGRFDTVERLCNTAHIKARPRANFRKESLNGYDARFEGGEGSPKGKNMANRAKGHRLTVVVGEVWPDEVVEVEAVEARAGQGDLIFASRAKTVMAQNLAWAGWGGLAVFALYGMLQADGALLDRVFNLIESTILFVLGWVVGHEKDGHGK